MSLSVAADALHDHLNAFTDQIRAVSGGDDHANLIGNWKEAHGVKTVKQAGSNGGRRVKQWYGTPHHRQIGQKGGEALKEQQGLDYYSTLGKMGGQTLKEKYEQSISFAWERREEPL
jgi:hypothetical protein